jgi:DNA-binding NtrC family response regulator
MIEAAKIAKENNSKVLHAIDNTSAMITLRKTPNVSLIIIDARLSTADLKKCLDSERFSMPIVACGLPDDQEHAVRSIKEGALEYITLPPNKEAIASLFNLICNKDSGNEVICTSDKFINVINMAKQIAPSIANVLISGRSGVGKEVVAKVIHENSKRQDRELVSINCAAIPENLLESEMFGHEKGAFTGALERRIGKFEEAHSGTLFLDEISEMDIKLQAKLLRAIQEKQIYRVGGNEAIDLDLRIIATSNRNLHDEVRKGSFREDLFYRLNVIHLQIPPLSEREADIKPLVEYFLRKFCQLNKIDQKTISEDALAKLQAHSWPGNVRELENTVHRSVLIAQVKEIQEGDISLAPEEDVEDLSTMERKAIHKALHRYDRNHELAAKVLGISIQYLEEKLSQYSDTD